MSEYPMQPIIRADDGVIRFQVNALVKLFADAVDTATYNRFWRDASVSDEDRMQFWQLVGGSVSGYGDLNEVTPESLERADAEAERLFR